MSGPERTRSAAKHGPMDGEVRLHREVKKGEQGSLGRRTAKSTAWSVVGQGMNQALRLASNLILTRLLAPELFGMMTLVTVFVQGLGMFTDVGVEPSIIQNRRGNDPDFLNTAWSVQLVRGASLWGMTCLAAWPLSLIYSTPELLLVVPAVGFSVFIISFQATSVVTAKRSLMLSRVVGLEIGSQALGIVVTIALASFWPSIWALVIGANVSALGRAALSHFVLPGIRNRFRWVPAYAKEILGFGRWILLSTLVGFLSMKGDQLMLSSFVPFAVLGVYGVAAQLSSVGRELAAAIASKVLFPLYSRLLESDASFSRPRIFKVRMVLMAALVPIPMVLAVYGELLVKLLYKSEFWDAGWMLQVLSIGSLAQILNVTFASVVLASGDSFRHLMMMTVRSIISLGCMALGAWLDGVRGLVIGLSAGRWLSYPVVIWAARGTSMWMPSVDLFATVYAAAIYLIGVAARPLVEQLVVSFQR